MYYGRRSPVCRTAWIAAARLSLEVPFFSLWIVLCGPGAKREDTKTKGFQIKSLFPSLPSVKTCPSLASFNEMIPKRIYAAWFVVHFYLITAVCFAGIFSLVAERATMLPSALDKYARKAELIAASVLGKEAGAYSPVRRGIATYLHAAGIQAGYTFFAPNIPGYYRLTLELHYADGRVENESPHVSGKAAALRLDSLLDRLADKRYEPLREVVVKMLALSVWRERPEVKKIRATFGAVSPPDISDFEHGKGESFQPIFTYDFSLRTEENKSGTTDHTDKQSPP